MSYSSLQNLKSKYRLKKRAFWRAIYQRLSHLGTSAKKGYVEHEIRPLFKKGNLPNNYRPVGSESEDKDGIY